MHIVNQTVPRALKVLGYSKQQIADIVSYIDTEKSILGAPHLKPEHEAVFACSMGDNAIHYLGHIKMMGAVQPFISGAISKTVNMPETVSVEDVEQLHVDSWKLGIKAVAIYRDNCKVGQPLSMAKKEVKEAPASAADNLNDKIIVRSAVRREMPKTRNAKTLSFHVADSHGYVTVGEYEDGTPGEVFIRIAKQGSTLAGIMDAFAMSISHGLQYGVPLKTYVKAFTAMSFAPAGITDDADIRTATSLVDYIFRRLALNYLNFDDRLELGLASIEDMPTDQVSLLDEAVAEQSEVSNEKVVAAAVTPEPTSVAASPVAVAKAPTKSKVTAHDSGAPMCFNCGNQTQKAGSCYVCTSCGSTTGCS
jgi:ribonucleoside-diphosphate reductase alpha chain